MNAYEISEPTREVLDGLTSRPGHYMVKLNPLASKRLLHEYGFYYCDTLIEPRCTAQRFVYHGSERVRISQDTALSELLCICHGAFVHGRFHRDFNIPRQLADKRYDDWLRRHHENGEVLSLFYDDALAGFIACHGARLVLHAVAQGLLGRGLAKYLWSAACRTLFNAGHEELSSSVSAANLAAVNLYASLGFRFTNAVDVYHKMVR